MDESPFPDYEWPALLAIFDEEDLAPLLRVSPNSVVRYSRGQRSTPDIVADRLHLLAQVAADLKGAYDEVGIRRWFHRPRTALDGSTPSELLTESWGPGDPGPSAVREFARSLLGA